MAKSTNKAIPASSQEELSTPDITKLVSKEVLRLTKELIDDTKELINVGTDYETIEYVDDQDPMGIEIDFLRIQLDNLKQEVQKKLDMGDKSKTDVFNYLEYLNMFSVRYNNKGEAEITLSIELPNFNLGNTEPTDLKRGN